MDYEKAYKDALERAKEIHDSPDASPARKKMLEGIFPDLIESEDERIRKELLSFIESVQLYSYRCATDRRKKWIAYLEKQKEQKEQKPELYDMGRWDEESYNNGINHVLHNPGAYGLTKQKPAKWSEEDLQHKSWILECLADGERKMPEYAEDFRAAYNWLKSLRPRPHWKPSEEQMS